MSVSPFTPDGAARADASVSSVSSVSPPASGSVTALTGDASLADELQRLAAAAGVRLSVNGQVPGAGRWPRGLVLVGADLARAVTREPARRSADLVLVGAGSDTGLAGGPASALWHHAVAVGAEQVALLPEAREWLVQRMARTVEPAACARVVGVIGGCGGAGASLFAATLATVAAEQDRRTLLVDVDPLGGGVDLALGLEDVVGLRWSELTTVRGRVPAAGLHEQLPRSGPLAVLGWGRGAPLDLPAAAVESVLDAGRRGHDLLVMDLPRSVDAVADAALARVDELLLVVPARMRAVVAARQVLATVEGRAPVVRAVVRRSADERWSPQRLAEALGVPLAAHLRDDPRLDAAVARGELAALPTRSPLRRAAEQCLAELAVQSAA